jgi:hypothetical protein
VVLIALPLLVFWPLILGGRVLYWGVPLYQFYPWHALVADAIRAGHLPLWTDLLGNGTPLLANHQSAVFYPPNLVYLLAPVERAMGYSVVLHLALAGLFAYAWGRTVGLSPFGGAITGLSFMFSGFLVGRTQFITIVNGAAWLPLIFLLTERLLRRPGRAGAMWLALAVALQFLAGHAQVWLYSLLAVAGYAPLRLWLGNQGAQTGAWGQRAQALAWLAAAMALALGLAAVQLLPTLELSLHSQRAGGIDAQEAMTYSFWPWRLLTLLAPDLFGSPAGGDYWGYATYWEDAGYLGVLPLVFGVYLVLAGAARLVRRQLGRWAGRQPARPEAAIHPFRRFLVAFFLLLAGVSLLLAMGYNTPVYPILFKYVPGFSAFRAPARFLVLYTLAASTLAGLGAEGYRLSYRTQYVLRLALAGAVATLTIALLAGQLGLNVEPTFAPAVARFAAWLALSAIILLLHPVRAEGAGDVDARVSRSPLPRGAWRTLAAGLVAVDLALFALPLTPSTTPALYRTVTRADGFLLERGDDHRLFATRAYDHKIKFGDYFRFSVWGSGELERWLALRETLVPNLNVFTATPSVNHDDPLVIGDWRELMDALEEEDWPVRLRWLRMMNVGYVLAESPPPGLRPVDQVPGLYRLDQPLPRAWVVPRARVVPEPGDMLAAMSASSFNPSQEVLLERPGPLPNEGGASTPGLPATPSSPAAVSLHEGANGRTIDLVVSQPGYLVTSYTFYPGWRATIDGRPAEILRANYAFMALPLEPGEHRVVFRYRPVSVIAGAALSVLSLLLVVGLPALRRIPIRRSRQVEDREDDGHYPHL